MTHAYSSTEPKIFIAPESIPSGFRFAATRAGIKPSGKPDAACALADAPASAAAMFTSNRVVAAPVTVGRRHMRSSSGTVRAVIINAGNANCATGAAGLEACQSVCAAAAQEFGCPVEQVFPSSTGIIGVPLPAEKLIAALPSLQRTAGATPEHVLQFAHAILTTDTRAKIAAAQVPVHGKSVRILGMAKGAGMIHPQLAPHATMLVYIFTDAGVPAEHLRALLGASVEESFNCISIDGDTSTNDTVLLLASGASGVHIAAGTPDAEFFASALREVCASLARQIVDDGEGVGHVVELQIEEAASRADALRIARSIAHSPLVKTAWAGCDPNWGRILAAIGYSGAAIDPDRVSIWIGGHTVCTGGGRAAEMDASRVHAAMLERSYTIRITLGMGTARCNFITSDLTAEYVRVNAEYST
jgi:glutamate N-acetyltransferase/amino-acid N-acetyltransferase